MRVLEAELRDKDADILKVGGRFRCWSKDVEVKFEHLSFESENSMVTSVAERSYRKAGWTWRRFRNSWKGPASLARLDSASFIPGLWDLRAG